MLLLLSLNLIEELVSCLSDRLRKLWGVNIVHPLVMHQDLRRETL